MPYNSRYTGVDIDSGIEKAHKIVDAGSESVPIYILDGVPTPCTSLNLPSSTGTAAVLQTPRNINDTQFDGSQDITTIKWGFARQFAIADNDLSHQVAAAQATAVDGSQNVVLRMPQEFKGHLIGVADTATVAEQAVKDGEGNAIASTYLPLSGGILTGQLYFGTQSSYINATNYTGSAASAIRAEQDSAGNTINNTYLPFSGGTMQGRIQFKTNAAYIDENEYTGRAASATIAFNDKNGNLIDTTYLKLNGGTLSGSLNTLDVNILNSNLLIFKSADTTPGGGFMFKSSSDGLLGSLTLDTDNIFKIGYGSTLYPILTSNNLSSYAPSLTGQGASGLWSIDIGGNAASADKLSTERVIAIDGAVTGSATFDGSTNITLTTNVNHEHNYAGSTRAGGPASSLENYFVLQVNGVNKVQFNGLTTTTYNLTAADLGLSQALTFAGQTSTYMYQGSIQRSVEINGNLHSAQPGEVVLYKGNEYVWLGSEWELLGPNSSFALSSITIGPDTTILDNPITGGGNLQNNVIIGHSTSPVIVGTYANENNLTLTAGDSFKVPTFEVNRYGHLVAASEHTITLPNTVPRLTTPRYINGTQFDGGQNITTLFWGTERQINITDSDGSNIGADAFIDGSENIELALPQTIKADITGNATSADRVASSRDNASTKLYVTCVNGPNGLLKFNNDVYIDASDGIIYGSAYNDYAEFREGQDEAGRVVCETGKGDLVRSTERLQSGARVVSDTYGFAIGETESAKLPIAISGRVLVYTYENREEFAAGDPVCSGPDGTVSKMSREEVREYPDRMIGTVSEIPDYEEWNKGIKVNGRIWIYIR